MSLRQRNGVLLNLLAALSFSFLPTIIKAIYELSSLRPTDIAIWRFTFAVPMLWLIVWIQRRRTAPINKSQPLPLHQLFLPGMLFASSALLAFAGLQSGISVSMFIVLFYTYPAMVALLALLMGKPLPLLGWLALGLTLIGIFLTIPDFSQLSADSWTGVLLALLNALSVTFYFLITARVFRGSTDSTRNTATLLTFTLIILYATIPVLGLQLPPSLPVLLLLIMLALVCSVVAIVSLNAGIQRIGAAQSAIVSSIEPATTMLVALILLGEPILPLQWVGAGFIIAAVILLQLRPATPSSVLSS